MISFLKTAIVCGTCTILVAAPERAKADTQSSNGPALTVPPPNGSTSQGGTVYTPVIRSSNGTSAGTSAGITSIPNPGTPSTPPSSTYGVGVEFPIPGK